MDIEDRTRLNNMLIFLKNFTSELSLEVLSTVDFILSKNPTYNLDEILAAVGNWNNRKKELFRKESVERAYNHLQNYKSQLNLS